jgi:hypothetical protein
MSAFLAAVLLVQSEVDLPDLIRRLGSDAPAEREEAAGRLKKLGPSAIPALEDVVRRGDADLRGRARQILEHIARVERVRALRPAERRISLELREEPLPDALRRVLLPFGLEGVRPDAALAERKVSLSLREASLWEAIEGLEKAADASLDASSGLLGEKRALPIPSSGTGPALIVPGGWGGHMSGKGPSRKALLIKAWFSPGSWVWSQEVGALEVVDAAGESVACDVHSSAGGERTYGLPSWTAARLTFDRERLKGVTSVTVRGTFRIAFPRDVEQVVTPYRDLPAGVEVGGGTLTLRKLVKEDRGTWDVDLSAASTGPEPISLLATLEDGEGRWLGDAGTVYLNPGVSTSSSSSGRRLREGTPARLAVFRATAVDTIEVPFRLPGIPVPP